MTDGFLVDTERLRWHARRVGMVRDDVALAADAAGQVNLNDGAFGLLCGFLPPIFGAVETAVGDAVTAACEVLDATGESLVAVGTIFDDGDADVGTGFTRLSGGAR